MCNTIYNIMANAYKYIINGLHPKHQAGIQQAMAGGNIKISKKKQTHTQINIHSDE